jgi:hypothetical protein
MFGRDLPGEAGAIESGLIVKIDDDARIQDSGIEAMKTRIT